MVPHTDLVRASWQVFGLIGASSFEVSYRPKLPRVSSSANLGFRSYLPLRGSSGLAPDSLLTYLSTNSSKPALGILYMVITRV